MEQRTQEKMESLQKYVPFIDFVLKIDEKKYIKFTNIRKWIVLRKTKYPLTALNKIEQSIITQYKNLLIENNVQIPENISNIFAPMNFKQYVNLCSDEEEDDAQGVHKKKEDNRTVGKPNASKERRKTNEKYSKTTKVEDSDDDLEIVSIDYVNKVEKKVDQNSNIGSTKVEVKQDVDFDDISKDILCRIDKLAEDDIKMKSLVHEPINYTYQEKDFCDISENNSEPAEEKIFERRTTSDVLFKRRTDFQDEIIDVTDLENNQNTTEMANFKDDEVEVQSIENNNKKFCAKKTIEIISLDSCSDSEFCSDDERPSTSKAAAIKATRPKQDVDEDVTIVKVNDKISEEGNSNSDNSNKKVEFLCNSIDSVSLDMNELMQELNGSNETTDASPTKTTIVLEKQTSEGSSDKENTIQPTDTNKTQNLNQEQICKLLEDISNNKDFDMDTFYAALSYVKQMNTTSSKTNPLENNSPLGTPTETPPPAPPPISNNLPTPPAHHQQHEQSPQYPLSQPQNVYYPAQQPQYIAPPLTPHYTQNGNYITMPGTAPPPRPKVNINDPRIIKQLQAIQNSPLFTYNVLNSETAASIMQICQSQKFQQPQQRANFQNCSTHPHNNNNNMAPANNTASTSNNFRKTTDAAASSSSNSITYGEYKRRQQQQKLQLERQREEERKAKLEREKQELLKKKEIRSQLLSTLTPCQDQLTTMWSQQKNLPKNSGVGGNKTTNVEQEKQKEKAQNVTTATVENNVDGKEKKSKTITIKKVYRPTKCSNNNTKVADTTQSKANNVDQKLNRVYNELKCTFKGFDQLHDYIPTVDQNSFRKSSEKRQKTTMNGVDDSHSNSTHSTEVAYEPRPIGLRRRSSIHALSAISEQLGQQSSDCSDCDMSQKKIDNRNQSTVGPKRLSIDTLNNTSSESLSQDFMRSFPKRRKTIDEVIKTTRRAKILRIVDDDSASCSSEDVISSSKDSVPLKQPVIKLQRITHEFIRKHTKRRREETDQSSRLKKNCERITNTIEPAQKLSKLKKYNNDCQMTERNTSFCTLCRSKPSDLTNHYIGRHKTESYVSRLDWSELDDLSINTPFAKLLPKTKNYRFDRYEVDCPFCKDKLVDQFINLYHHYSAHTGEYAFQCSHCNLTKPYRPDIQSHILHSKTCRNSTINILYRYPPNAQCIYLHYCTICNFVQLNEANVLKHLREHHHSSKAIPSNVQKYILAAMSDGPDANEFNKPPTPTTTPPVQKETTVDRVERTSPPPPSPAIQKETTVDSNSSNSTTMACSSSSNGLELNSVQLPGEELQATTCDLHFKVDDDDIPVTNEPCVEEEFLDEGKYSLEEQLKQLHEGPAPTLNTPAPMTVIHCLGNHLKDSPNAVTNRITHPTPPDRHLPMIIKTEHMELEENLLITPPRPSCYKTQEAKPITPPIARNQSGIYEKYRSYPQNVNYLGLYKCMIDDCYYSTDCSEDLCTHLTDHSSVDLKTIESLQCPYCDLPMEMPMSPLQLVEHVGSQHAHLIYQCSMCCYRSCDASNVNVHQQLHHNIALNSCKIYKCSSDDLKDNSKLKQLDLNEKIVKNIFKLVCTVCNAGFYHTHFLINHLNSVHRVYDADDLKIYSCIYCPLTVGNKHEIRSHVAIKHPGKLPRVYDHNTQCNSVIEDVIRSSDIVCLSESVVYEEIRAAASESNEDNLPLDIEDIKPDPEKLLEMNEETIRARLRKLIAHTGVAPDKLYRCPESTCGGFFSIFDLWLRHMKVRHHSLECQCPHCPTPRSLSLEKFSLHFEEHRRHTFICFHCPTTCPNETLAKQHFAENHADLGGTMRCEQIRFNLCYSYSIMMQSDLCKDRKNFIAEFLVTLDSRLNDLESSEIQKLKHQWPVQDNTVWIDDYLPQLYNRKVLRTCLMKDCAFRTLREDSLFYHLRTSHVIEGTTFNCSKCKYSIEICSSFDEIINHIKMHSEFICICAACSLGTSSRSKMCTHIAGQHSARDVPVIELFKINQLLFIKIYIVFSDNHLTFSTMKNCFCCPEKNMNGDVFSLHLKRYHKFSLNYYCEKCPSFHFKSLKDVKSHFQQLHPSDKLKVRCELSSPNDLSVTSLNEFQVQISIGDQLPLNIKDEPIDVSNTDNDDDVILLEDNDIVIQESLKDDKLQQPKEMPKLKCASLSKLMQPTTSSLPSSSSPMQPNCLPMQQVFHQPLTSTSESFPNTTFVTAPYGNNNLGALINNYTNVSINHANTLSSTPRVNTNLIYKLDYMPHYNNMQHQIVSLPPPQPTNDRTNSITFSQRNLYTGQTRLIQIPENNSMSTTPVITQNYDALTTLNGQNNV